MQEFSTDELPTYRSDVDGAPNHWQRRKNIGAPKPGVNSSGNPSRAGQPEIQVVGTKTLLYLICSSLNKP